MMETTHSKLYRIQSEPSHFYAGHLQDGMQVFMSVDYPDLITVLFDREGKFSKILKKEISQDTQLGLKIAIKQKDVMFNKDWEELDQWVSELGLTKGVISVQKFSLPEIGLSIQNLPSIYQELLESDEDINEDIEDVNEQIKVWQQYNDFVLVWGNEYDINAEGEVVST